METKKVEVEVLKEAHELGLGLAGVALAIKAARADGWDTATDVPLVLLECIKALVPAVDGIEKMPEEAKANPVKFAKSMLLPILDATEALTAKA